MEFAAVERYETADTPLCKTSIYISSNQSINTGLGVLCLVPHFFLRPTLHILRFGNKYVLLGSNFYWKNVLKMIGEDRRQRHCWIRINYRGVFTWLFSRFHISQPVQRLSCDTCALFRDGLVILFPAQLIMRIWRHRES